MKIFNRKQGTERHLSQLFFVLCGITYVDSYIIPPFKHVHILTETVDTEKQVT